jgi:hypothetical protein
MELSEILRDNTVISVDDKLGFMVVAPHESVELRDPGVTRHAAIAEMGYTAPSPFTSWTRRDDNTKLNGQSGIRIYYNMRRQDGAVRASMRLVKTPVQSAHWFVEPYTPDSNTPPTEQDKKIATFVEDNLMNKMNVSWSTVLADVLLMLDYGYMAFEKVWRSEDSDGKMRLQKLAPRHPLDIQEWFYDRNGGPDGCRMYSNPYSGPSPLGPDTGMAPATEDVLIPIVKMVVFTHDMEAGDLTGISILRSAYKHWYYKDTLYKIDAIQKERHGIGIPIIKLPPGFTVADQQLADNLGRNLRTNERAHITLPPMWDVIFAKLEGQPVDCLKSIQHHDMRIKSNVLGAFLDAESGTSDPNIDIFLKSTRYIADVICDIINKHVIPQLVDINFKLGASRGYPSLRARRIGEWDDLRTLSFAVRNLVGSDVIRADDVLEAHIRREMDLPAADPKTARTPIQIHPAPANAPEVTGSSNSSVVPSAGATGTAVNGGDKQNAAANKPGLPRQSAPNAHPTSGTGTSNAGIDRSGNK